MFRVSAAEDASSKLPVLKALTRKFRLGVGVDLAAVALAAPGLATGADLYALAADAWTVALRRTIANYGDEPIPVRGILEPQHCCKTWKSAPPPVIARADGP